MRYSWTFCFVPLTRLLIRNLMWSLFIKFSESFSVRSFNSFPGSGFGIAMMSSEVLMLAVV